MILRPCTEAEYHRFFRGYIPNPVMEPMPFVYNEETVSRSYQYNYHFRENYAHYGIFLENLPEQPIGLLQLKRMDETKKRCEFGIILQNSAVMNRGYGTEAVRIAMRLARENFGMKTMLGDTSSRNLSMIRVFEKLNFHLVEQVRDAFLAVNGQPGDRLVYERSLLINSPTEKEQRKK